jgi:hypothetical protein
MRFPRIVGLIVLAALLAGGAARAEPPAPEPLPTNDELHQMYKDQQYAPLLLKLARVMQLRGNAARPYDHVELLLLKTDTHLQMKEQALAVAAAAAAVKAIDDQTDPKLAATAKATEKLLRQSRNYAFTPRTAPRGQIPQPISVLDPDKRKDCFAAMFEDSRTEILAKVRVAKTARTLVPIIDAIKAVSDLRTLEMAAYGKDELSAAQLDGLSLQAKDLMSRAVKDLKDQADKCHDRANEVLPAQAPVGTGGIGGTQMYYKKGLYGTMYNDLKKIISQSEQIAEAAKQFADLSKATADGFGEVQDAAEKVAKSAKTTLEDDYSGTFTK